MMTVSTAKKTSPGSNRVEAVTRSGGSGGSRRRGPVKEKTPAAGAVSEEKVRMHRKRQVSVASILEATFGTLAECHPDLWDRQAYLMLVGLVYDRLAASEAEIPTDELVALAKVLVGSRRAAVRVEDPPQKPNAKGKAAPRKKKLPQEFADVVRQVYGTNYQSPSQEQTDKPAPARERSKASD